MVKLPKDTSSSTISTPAELGELSYYQYRQGYLNAAENLSSQILEFQQDETVSYNFQIFALIYPTMHLYRHFIELTLKDYINLAIALDIGNADIINKRKAARHNLQELYNITSDILSKINGTIFTTIMHENCQPLIHWFHEKDQLGDKFRYPLNTQGKVQFAKSFMVDLKWIRTHVRQFDNFLNEEFENLRRRLDPNATYEEYSSRVYFWFPATP